MIISKRCGRMETRLLVAFVALVISLGNAKWAVAQTIGPIGPDFFGMSVNDVPAAPWPATLGVPFASWRTLGVSVKWSDIEPNCDGGSDPTNSCYAWSDLDSWISQARGGGADVMYTIYSTPTWASSNKTDTSCIRGTSFPAGSCWPPIDIDAVPNSGLGDGTNKHFQDFLNAMMSHLGPGTVKYWEVWDEPSVARAWRGTNAQLVRLAKDTYAIVKADPDALTATPPYVGNGIRQPFAAYLNAGGGQYADVIDYHGYLQTGTCPTDCPIPENEVLQINVLKGVLQTAGQTGKPIFDTEGSWGNYVGTETITDPDQQVAFTGRYYLLHVSGNISKLYWYTWNNSQNGHFYDVGNGTIIPAGTAYEQIYSWLVGATLTGPCANFNTQWFCSMTRPGSYVAEAIWDTNSSFLCSGGTCPTANVAVPTHYTQYRDLKGTSTLITNHTVPVGSKPILVEGTTPEISVTETESPSVGLVGGTVTYTTVVTNNTAAAIGPVTVVDNLDPSLTFSSCSSTPHGVCQSASNSVTVTISSMASKETDTITIVATLASTAAGTILNTATANWSGGASTNWSTAALPVGTPGHSAKPTLINFGNQTVNTASSIKNVVVTNTGTGTLSIYNIGTTGNNNTDFSFTSSGLPITVAPQAQTTIGVKFTPAGLGNRTATLYIYDNTTSGNLTVGLTGNGASPSTTSLSTSVNPALYGQSVMFTATVSCPSSFVPPDTVTFKRGNTVLGTGTLNGSGSATFTTSTLPVGWQTITAVYGGDGNCGTSSGSVSQGVKLPSAVAITSTLNPSHFGQAVTFNAKVSSSGGGTPSGSVTFRNGGTKLGTVTLDGSGNASFTTSTLSLGSHSITASYGGNTIYFTSTSPVLNQNVN